MKTYKVEVARTITVVADFYVEGTSEDDATAKFIQRIDTEQCDHVENYEWVEDFSRTSSHPYSGTYEVLDVEEEEEEEA